MLLFVDELCVCARLRVFMCDKKQKDNLLLPEPAI